MDIYAEYNHYYVLDNERVEHRYFSYPTSGGSHELDMKNIYAIRVLLSDLSHVNTNSMISFQLVSVIALQLSTKNNFCRIWSINFFKNLFSSWAMGTTLNNILPLPDLSNMPLCCAEPHSKRQRLNQWWFNCCYHVFYWFNLFDVALWMCK